MPLYQCTGCARTAQRRPNDSPRCIYCGGEYKPVDDAPEQAGQAGQASQASQPARPLKPLRAPPPIRSAEPSTAQRIIGWCLFSLASVALALVALRHYPGLEPRVLIGVGALLSVLLGAGGATATQAWAALTSKPRGTILLVGLAALALLLFGCSVSLLITGLLWVFVQSFVRRAPAVYGVPVLLLALVGVGGLAFWTEGSHDPGVWLHDAATGAPGHADHDPDFALRASVWAGELSTRDDVASWRLSILDVEEDTFRATLYIGDDAAQVSYDIVGAHRDNYIVYYQEGIIGNDAPSLFSLFGGVTDAYILNGDSLSFTEAGGRITVIARATSGGGSAARELLGEETNSLPEFTDLPVYQPGFTVSGQRLFKGRLTAVKPRGGGKARLITAVSLFGPPGGLEAAIPAEQIPGALTDPWFYDPVSGVKTGRAGAWRAIPGARPVDFSIEGIAHAPQDLAVFSLTDVLPVEPLSLSGSDLKPGQVGWFPVGTRDEPGDVLSVEIIDASDEWQLIRLPPDTDTSRLIGAPLLTDTRLVAGILVGLRGDPAAGQFGAVAPSSALQSALSTLP